jgi:hypothetical protein
MKIPTIAHRSASATAWRGCCGSVFTCRCTGPRGVPFTLCEQMILRLFGAKMGPGGYFYPSGRVWAPWNLVCEDGCTLADSGEIFNSSPIYLDSHCIISQQAYVRDDARLQPSGVSDDLVHYATGGILLDLRRASVAPGYMLAREPFWVWARLPPVIGAVAGVKRGPGM